MRKLVRKFFVSMRRSFWRVSYPYAITIIGFISFACMAIAMAFALMVGNVLSLIGVSFITSAYITVFLMFFFIGVVILTIFKINDLMINHYFDN